MNGVIGDLLPLAIGVAISPLPIIAVILMLLSPKAGGTSVGFLLGWVVGIAVATTAVTLVAALAGLGAGTGGSSAASGGVKIVLGALLVLLGWREWRSRPKPGTDAPLPKWMAAIEEFTFVKAAGLGFVLAAVNPKNLLMCAGAGTVVAGAGISVSQQVVAVAVFTVLAACTVAVPVIAYLIAKERMRHPLDELKVWLQANNAAVMSVVLVVLGITVIGKGIGGL
jgi:threonine/homoserine/homoserine lactone efflux protein